jgi:5-methylcytosine-specific restriction endonuclease McrA
MNKTCTLCGVCGDVSLFQKDKKAAGGFRNRCKRCANSLNYSWKKNNPEYMPEYLSSYNPKYAKANRSKLNSKEAKRRATKLKQTPDLSEKEKEMIDDFYWLARDLRVVTGEEYHVDHIHPISKGGLHHPDNLQILPSDLNIKKSNKVHLSAKCS